MLTYRAVQAHLVTEDSVFDDTEDGYKDAMQQETQLVRALEREP